MTSYGSSVPRIQVFRPSMEEFKNFSKYIEKIESMGAHKAGLAKIIPPEGWNPRKKGYADIDLTIPAPISQVVTGRQGLYQQINIQQKAMSVKEFQKLAESTKYKTPSHFDYEDLERKYWKNITYNSPIYGADVSGSLYDDGVDEFNIQHLNTILDMVKKDYEIQIEGVNTAYLYFGMWKTTFAWHTEDMDLYSINYLHFGAPKSWYVIPPEHGRRLERLASGFFHGSFQSCQAFLRHKMTIISPQILKQYSIPYSKITQEPGEFMITFPFGYHSGFNHGFNCAESTNFALPRWVEYGKRTTSCTCRNDCVKICMDMFVKKFQPDRYELWKVGKDYGVHPEDPNKHCFAPAPRKVELAMCAQKERKKAKMTQFAQKIKRHPISRLERLERKQALLTEQSEQEEYSDSALTEIYDVDEAILNKNQCNRKKRRKKSKILKNDSCEETSVLCELTSAEDTNTEHSNNGVQMNVESSNNGAEMNVENLNNAIEMNVENSNNAIEMNEENLNNASEIKVENMNNAEEKNVEVSNIPVHRYVEVKLEKLQTPPELSPFWDLENKQIQKDSSNISQSNDAVVTSVAKCEKQILLEKYPQLKEAVSSGQLSLFNVEPDVKKAPITNSPTNNNDYFDAATKNENQTLFTNNKFSETIFSQDWKCEQTHGLKIRFVQPKKFHQDSKESLKDNIQPQNSLDSLSDMQQAMECDVNPENESISKETFTANINNKELVPSSPSSSNITAKDPSDSPSNSKIKVKRAANSFGNWAQPLQDLWQHLPFNFEAECAFNEKFSRRAPHCAICIIFSPIEPDTFDSSESHDIPEHTSVKMPSFCYRNDPKSLLETNPLDMPDGSSPLLICSSCKVCVHATCYGVTMIEMGSWICTRCASDHLEVECCLCVLRGGALKPTNDNQWVHVICAILIQETYFENLLFKQPVNISYLTPNRQRLKCKYCFKSTSFSKEIKGACVQCQSGKCYLPFHVTCGYMAGVIFETSDWPEPVKMICTKHASARRKPAKRVLTSLDVGEKVAAKHKNKRYYWATVKEKFIQDYYSILFDDNSHSTNTLPEDIVSRNVMVEGPPEINERLRVKWTDGKIYNCVFKGSQSCEIFAIEFDDGSVLHQERQKIYSSNEKLPKEIISRMSYSSERKNDLSHTSPNGKRLRICNAKYSPE